MLICSNETWYQPLFLIDSARENIIIQYTEHRQITQRMEKGNDLRQINISLGEFRPQRGRSRLERQLHGWNWVNSAVFWFGAAAKLDILAAAVVLTGNGYYYTVHGTPDKLRSKKTRTIISRTWSALSSFRSGHSSPVTLRAKLQALVYDILPSTTVVFSYVTGSWKRSANEQFLIGAHWNSNKFVTNNSNKTRRVIYSRQRSLHQYK